MPTKPTPRTMGNHNFFVEELKIFILTSLGFCLNKVFNNALLQHNPLK
jgi:hypothetical protein